LYVIVFKFSLHNSSVTTLR